MHASNGEFTSTIRNQILEAHDAGHRRHSHNMSSISLNHLRQESLEHPEVRHEVDLDDAADLLLGVLEEVVLRHDAGVVDQNRHCSDLGEHFAAGFQNLFAARDVDTGKCVDMVTADKKLFWATAKISARLADKISSLTLNLRVAKCLSSARLNQLNRSKVQLLVDIPANDRCAELGVLHAQLFAHAVTGAGDEHDIVRDIACLRGEQVDGRLDGLRPELQNQDENLDKHEEHVEDDCADAIGAGE